MLIAVIPADYIGNVVARLTRTYPCRKRIFLAMERNQSWARNQ